MAFPSSSELRSASFGLMLAPLASVVTSAIDKAIEVGRYHSYAAGLGVARERADDLLAQGQGLAAGSTPSTAELAAARNLVITEAMG